MFLISSLISISTFELVLVYDRHISQNSIHFVDYRARVMKYSLLSKTWLESAQVAAVFTKLARAD